LSLRLGAVTTELLAFKEFVNALFDVLVSWVSLEYNGSLLVNKKNVWNPV